MGDPNAGITPSESVDWLDQMATAAISEIERMHTEAQATLEKVAPRQDDHGHQNAVTASQATVWPSGEIAAGAVAGTGSEDSSAP